jgi:tripartite-type tricarboxylate transporter receptor subunit TctC
LNTNFQTAAHRGISRRAFACAGAALLGAPALAQEDKSPIRLLCGLAAGTGNDYAARMLAETMHEALGRTVVVENKPGVGQRLALSEVRRAAPDGRTLVLATTGPFTIYPHIYQKLDYDPFKDFTVLGGLASFDVAIAVGPQVPATSVQQLVEMAKGNKQFAAYGSPGNGSLSHFVGIAFGIASGLDLMHVPYKDLTQGALDLAAGRLPFMITGVSNLLEFHKAGRVRILAVSGEKRSPLLPEVPTLKQAGVNVSSDTGVGVFGPPGMAPDLVQRLSTVIVKAAQAPDAGDKLARFAFVPQPATAAQFTARMQNEYALFDQLAKATGYVRE